MNKFLRFFIKLSIITMLFPAKILSLSSKCTYLFDKLDCVNNKNKKSSLFILYCIQLALIFDKLGCVSTIKIKNLRFLFCIVFNLH